MADVDEIKAAEDTLRVAMLTGDVGALGRLLDDRLAFIDPEGHVISKDADVEAHKSARVTYQAIEPTAVIISAVADDLAFVYQPARVELVAHGNVFKGQVVYTRVWRLSDGRWTVVAGHCSLSGEPTRS